jgi:hypothetical protein
MATDKREVAVTAEALRRHTQRLYTEAIGRLVAENAMLSAVSDELAARVDELEAKLTALTALAVMAEDAAEEPSATPGEEPGQERSAG